LSCKTGSNIQDILSSCDKRILVGLARMNSVDEKVWKAVEDMTNKVKAYRGVCPGSGWKNTLVKVI
jgi:hypothetical protein